MSALELHISFFRRVEPHFELAIGPFVDVGHSWNANREEFGDQTLFSAGIGSQVEFPDDLRLEVLWGESLQNVPRVDDYDLQDDGLHFRATAVWP